MKELFEKYIEAKRNEDNWKERRRKLANEIAKSIDVPDEGAKTHRIDGYKVTVKGVVNRKVDWALFDIICDEMKVSRRPDMVKQVREIDVNGLEWYREHEPWAYVEIAKAVTATPGQVQVKVEVDHGV